MYEFGAIVTFPVTRLRGRAEYILLNTFSLQVFLYGGYSKEVSSDKSISEKGIVHSDMWSLDPRTWEWNKVDFFFLFLFSNRSKFPFMVNVYCCPFILFFSW
jgi:hypothetical protein